MLSVKIMRFGRFLSSAPTSRPPVLVPTEALMKATAVALQGLKLSPRDIRATPALKMQAYEALYKNEFVRKTLGLQEFPLHGKAHQNLLNVGVVNSEHLGGGHVGGMGTTSCRIFDSEGIGKSTVLSALVPLLRHMYPKVIPVDINMQECSDKFHFLSQRHITEEIVHQLDQHTLLGEGISAGDGSRGQLTEALMAADKYIFLMVDELDMMYRLKNEAPDVSSYANARYTLSELGGLGNESSERYYTFFAGPRRLFLPSSLESQVSSTKATSPSTLST